MSELITVQVNADVLIKLRMYSAANIPAVFIECCVIYSSDCTIQGVTGGTDQTSGECSLC